MEVLISKTMRGIVTEANSLKIKKENIVTLFKEGDQYMLVYYK